ncbi:hypothetical protein BJ170DRAFT_685972 [Xylariales sp. AK1849]|nr:hypothetical protein BJ170DRAFT_685972 [Xylariales sp. AK1849]
MAKHRRRAEQNIFKPFPRLPKELRLMIWEQYEIPRTPMVHVISISTEPYGYRLTSFDMLDPQKVPTTRSLLQVNHEARAAVLKTREVFRPRQQPFPVLCAYGMRWPRPYGFTVRKLVYPNFFVDWERDLFYFKFIMSGVLPPLLQESSFTAKVQSIAFDLVPFACRSILMRTYLRSGSIPWKKGQKYPKSYAPTLPALLNMKFVVPAETFLYASGLGPMTKNHRDAVLEMKTAEYGFSPTKDATDCVRSDGKPLFKTPGSSLPQIFRSFETLAHTELKELCNGRSIETEVVMDHLGYDSVPFGGYSRLNNEYIHWNSWLEYKD